MLNLTLHRAYRGAKYTVGKLYINGKYFCDTMEDVDRGLDQNMSLSTIQNLKIYQETAIPTGQYKIDMNIVSPKYSNFSKYPWAKPYGGKIPRLLNVKGFQGVLIHPGNTKEDTAGCILVGENKAVGKVLNSQATFKKLMEILLKDKDIKLTIKH